MYTEPVGIAQAHAKCQQEGLRLAIATMYAQRSAIEATYRAYRIVLGGTERALAALPSESAENCLVIDGSGMSERRPCDVVGLPICGMNN